MWSVHLTIMTTFDLSQYQVKLLLPSSQTLTERSSIYTKCMSQRLFKNNLARQSNDPLLGTNAAFRWWPLVCAEHGAASN